MKKGGKRVEEYPARLELATSEHGRLVGRPLARDDGRVLQRACEVLQRDRRALARALGRRRWLQSVVP
eukprot:scaffold25488_cov64-Phaeocystis_antarctica.AAC.2